MQAERQAEKQAYSNRQRREYERQKIEDQIFNEERAAEQEWYRDQWEEEHG